MIKFKNIPKEERPRERLLLYGVDSLSNEELLMIILKTGIRDKSVKELSMEVLSRVGGIKNLNNLSLPKLQEIDGIGQVKAIEIMAVIELGKRINNNYKEEMILLNNPGVIVNYFNSLLRDLKQEVFYCVYLDNKKKYIDMKKLFMGTINSSLVHPREIFREAYLLSASYIICIHNHPSGDPTPSSEDINITNLIKEVGSLHAIYLVDHIIIGNNIYYSFFENKMI